MNFMPFGQLKSFLKILIEVQYKTLFGENTKNAPYGCGHTVDLLRYKALYQLSIFRNCSMYRPAGTSQLKSFSMSRFCRARKASRL